MKAFRFIALVLVISLLLAGCALDDEYYISEDHVHAQAQHVIDSPKWVKALPQAQDKSVKQLFIVAGMGKDLTTATISMHHRDADGEWMQILSTPGFVGENGLCPDADFREGSAQTPMGVYRFNKAFGIASDPGSKLPYTKVDNDTYWSGDKEIRYNELVRISDYPGLDTANSQHIVDYEYHYQYCLSISFNEECTPGRGFAIFLHCFSSRKPFTSGGVAVPEYIMKQIVQTADENCVVIIDIFDNLKGKF